MVFKGFNIKYPEYEVITPHTNQSFTVRSLNVSEEERLKGSLLTPTKIAEHLNRCLYDSIVVKPEGIETYDAFLKNLTLKDRDALLYGLYHITYEEIRNYQIKCGECSNEFPVSVEVSKTFNANPYPGDDILQRKVRVDLPLSQGVFALIKQPTLFDEISIYKELGSRPGSSMETLTEILMIVQFEQDVEIEKEPVVYKAKNDVYDAFLQLPAKDKRAIFKAYTDAFGQYGIELKMQTYCPKCGADEIHDIDLVENFFRSLYST
jgi:hypothetical protein